MEHRAPRSLTLLVWSCVALAAAGFVSPWVHIDLIKETDLERSITRSAKRAFGKTFGGSGTSENFWAQKTRRQSGLVPTRVSGIRIPWLANRNQTKVMVGLARVFLKDADKQEIEQIGWKSYGVWLVPGLAALCALLLTAFAARPPVVISLGALCAAVAAIGAFQLVTVELPKGSGMSFGTGLWMSLAAYAGLAAAAALHVTLSAWFARRGAAPK